MRKVELTMDENVKCEVIKKLVESDGNKKRAAVKLNCTLRTINRLIRRYKEEGKAAFSHGNHRNKPGTTISQKMSNEIVLLYENKYEGANLRHFTELLLKLENIHISENSVRSILLSEDIISPNKYLRYYLIEATNSIRCHESSFAAYYRKKYDESKTHQHKRELALTSRKTIRLIYSFLDKNQLYSANRVQITS